MVIVLTEPLLVPLAPLAPLALALVAAAVKEDAEDDEAEDHAKIFRTVGLAVQSTWPLSTNGSGFNAMLNSFIITIIILLLFIGLLAIDTACNNTQIKS